MADPITFLSIGHVCHDKVGDDYILGGTAAYSAVLAQYLGAEVSLLTSIGKDFLFAEYFKELNIQFDYLPAERTTVFENIYIDNVRTQYLYARANTIRQDFIKGRINQPKIVHIGTIADEIQFDICTEFSNSIIGATIQGCLRTWEHDGKVSSKVMEWEQLLNVDIVFISDDDLEGIEEELPNIIKYSKMLVMTFGTNGAKVFTHGKEYYFPSFPTTVVDATGAGDTFSTAFLLQYALHQNIEKSCYFAHCAASIIIEQIGLSAVLSTEDVLLRVDKYKILNNIIS